MKKVLALALTGLAQRLLFDLQYVGLAGLMEHNLSGHPGISCCSRAILSQRDVDKWSALAPSGRWHVVSR